MELSSHTEPLSLSVITGLPPCPALIQLALLASTSKRPTIQIEVASWLPEGNHICIVAVK
ncbi:hypothetical protein ALO86_200121 [Pseudomonas syringae pv. berberidis]|nr:hypothetical protein ALO86_200121 [Pseudomonas syringae pv. berberidis]